MGPTVSIINTSPTPDGKNLYMYLVDPNPDKNEVYNTEDYFIYVNLTAYPKNRSVVIEDNDAIEFESSNRKINIISFITTTKQNEKDYLTTNYLNVDGTESNIEGFGIEGIQIENKANFVPKVIIDFFDVKGSSLKEFDLSGGSKQSDNPLSIFFSQPYPLFKLTVKGFYGKAVNYCLHFMKMDASFDSGSGGFKIKAEFVGYTYAFFADIPMRYLYALPNTPEGRKKLEAYNSISFSDLLNSYTQLTRFVENYKNTNENYEQLRVFNTLMGELNEIQDMAGRFLEDDNPAIYGNLIAYEGLSPENHIFVKEVGLFNISARAAFNNFKSALRIAADNYNQLVDEIGGQGKHIAIKIPDDNISLTEQEAINKIKEEVLKTDHTVHADSIDKEFLSERFDGFKNTPNQTQFFVASLFDLRNGLKNLYEQISDNKKILESSVVDNINQEILARFNPTVDTLFSVIAANVEAFLSLLYDYSYEAARPEKQQARITGLSGVLTDVKDGDVIHPFPDVIIGNERSWLGEIKNIDSEAFPEIKFINLLVNSLLDVNNLQSKADYTLKLYDGLNAQDAAWFPINTLDYDNNIFNSINVNNPLQSFYYALIERFLILKNYSRYADTNRLGKMWAEIEAAYAYNSIENDNLKGLVANNPPDVAQILSNAQNDNIIFNLNGYDLVRPSLSGIEFSARLSFVLKSKNEDLFESLRHKQNTYHPEIYQIIEKHDFYTNITDNNAFELSTRDFLFSDYTLLFFDPEIYNRIGIESIRGLKSLNTIDGTEIPLNQRLSETVYNLSANTLICRYLYDDNDGSKYSIFDTDNYHLLSLHEQRFLILDNLGVYKDVPYFFENFTQKAAVYEVKQIDLLYIGCIIHLNKTAPDGQHTIFDTFPQLLDYSQALLDVIESYYLEYDFSGWAENFSTYSNVHKNKAQLIYNNDLDFDSYKEAYNFIFNIYKKTELVLIPSPVLLFDENFSRHSKATQTEIENYVAYFRLEFNRQHSKSKNVAASKNDKNERVLNDKNILIEIYNDIKAIYDKWIGVGIKDGKIFNACFDLKDKRLFDHFYFIDRSWNYIGDKAVINPRTVISLFKNDAMNCYQYMTHILNNNNFLTFFAPSYVSFNNEDDLIDMFTPQTSLQNAASAPSMIAMYQGNASKFLDTDLNYKGDGFSLTSEDLPKEFSTRKKSGKHTTDADANQYNISSFLVNFGDQNQSHFTDVNINTEEHQNTAEYLRTISDIIDKGGAIKRFYKGVDLYDIFKLRSYSCAISGMGNMMIQPHQYFQLNVPMFKGAYIITSVSHSIVPHYHTTQFKGYKISKYLYPLVDEITSYVDLSLSEAYDSSTIRLGSPEIFEDSVGFDQGTQTSTITPITMSQADRLLFSLLNENGQRVEYRLADTLTLSSFQANLSRVFKDNASSMNKYGLSGGYCMAWAKNVMADLGVYAIPFGGLDAWDMFAGLNNSKLKYFDLSFSPNAQARNYNYNEVITDKLSFVFGYFNTSRFKNVSINAIKNRNDAFKIERLSTLNRTNMEFTPITHIGIVYNGIYYDFVNNKIRQGPTTSFVPVAYYELYNDIIFTLQNNSTA